nr:hypothetical protein [Tanacetum cinerariifolium]
DVEVQEVRPMGRDTSRKKASSSTAHSESSVEVGILDALLNKWKNIVTPLFSQREKAELSLR